MAIRVVIIYQRLAALLGVEYGRGVHAFDHILGGIYCCIVNIKRVIIVPSGRTCFALFIIGFNWSQTNSLG